MANHLRYVALKRHNVAAQQFHIATTKCQYKMHFALRRNPFVITLHSQHARKIAGEFAAAESAAFTHTSPFIRKLYVREPE